MSSDQPTARRRRLSVTIMTSDGYLRSLDAIVGDTLMLALSHFSASEAARQLGMGRSTVYRHLARSQPVTPAVRQRRKGTRARVAVIAKPSARLWSPDQIAKLKAAWLDEHLNITDIALSLGRTREAVKLKAQRLGLGRLVWSGVTLPVAIHDETAQRKSAHVAALAVQKPEPPKSGKAWRNGRVHSRDWTFEEVAQLQSMWASDDNPSNIGRVLRRSREAIIQKARRIGLPRIRRRQQMALMSRTQQAQLDNGA